MREREGRIPRPTFAEGRRSGERVPEALAGLLGRDGRACASHGDATAAWRHLLDTVRAMALDRARRNYRLGWEDAEDVAQVVQIRVAERLPQLRQPGAFPAWLRRLVHRAVLDLLRRRRPMLALDDVSPLAVATADPYDQVLMRADLDRALATLPELYREPIRLHLLHGIPQDEVGRLLDRPRSTVATQIERGLTRLRHVLT